MPESLLFSHLAGIASPVPGARLWALSPPAPTSPTCLGGHHYKRLIGFAVLPSLLAAAREISQAQNRSVLTYLVRDHIRYV
jgi:hypothetical protein